MPRKTTTAADQIKVLTALHGGVEAVIPRTKKVAAEGRAKPVSVQEFMAKHASELAEAEELKPSPPLTLSQIGAGSSPELRAWFKAQVTPASLLMDKLKQWWLFRLLAAAKTENCPQAYRELLEFFLARMKVSPPEGVLIPLPGDPGRPRSEVTSKIYRTWVLLGKPSLYTQKLSRQFYGSSEFAEADSGKKKKMVDQCRQAVRRHRKRIGDYD